MDSRESVTLPIRVETVLVIFEYLAQNYDKWRKSNPTSDDTFALQKPDSGERVALWRLEGAIESTLPEIFSPEYRDLITREKQRLTAELYGPAKS